MPTSALLFKTQEPGTGMTCCYCQQPHPSTDCTSVPNVSARKEILKTSGRCFYCLRKGHLGRNCRSMRKCQKCKSRHHTSICEAQDHQAASHSPMTPSLLKPSTSTPSNLDPAAPTYTPTMTTNALCPHDQKAVLLQTAHGILYNPTKLIEVRLRFDTGQKIRHHGTH